MRKNLSTFFVAGLMILAMAGCSQRHDDMSNESMSNDNRNMEESGQCWDMKGGVGHLLKNSSTKDECKELGGKSWCPTGGGCEDL